MSEWHNVKSHFGQHFPKSLTVKTQENTAGGNLTWQLSEAHSPERRTVTATDSYGDQVDCCWGRSSAWSCPQPAVASTASPGGRAPSTTGSSRTWGPLWWFATGSWWWRRGRWGGRGRGTGGGAPGRWGGRCSTVAGGCVLSGASEQVLSPAVGRVGLRRRHGQFGDEWDIAWWQRKLLQIRFRQMVIECISRSLLYLWSRHPRIERSFTHKMNLWT